MESYGLKIALNAEVIVGECCCIEVVFVLIVEVLLLRNNSIWPTNYKATQMLMSVLTIRIGQVYVNRKRSNVQCSTVQYMSQHTKYDLNRWLVATSVLASHIQDFIRQN